MTEATAIQLCRPAAAAARRLQVRHRQGPLYATTSRSPGMLHMAVLRSPHAHAVIKQGRSLGGQGRTGRSPCFVRRRPRRQDRLDRAELDHSGHARYRTGRWSRSIGFVSSANASHWWSPKRQAMALRRRRADRSRLRNASRRDRRGSRDPRRRTATPRQRAEQHHHDLQDAAAATTRRPRARPIRSSRLRVANNRLIPTCMETRSILPRRSRTAP